ncbi:MAG: sugar ABC transporter substrate-binding protein [Firmicutes bacterium]|nr:sugar ABC transporter substrate-binding protein [Bacillota bacterium]
MSKNRTSWSMTLVLCVAAVLCAGGCLVLAQDSLLFYTWARPEEMDDYKPIFDKFEAETGLKVEVQGFAGRVSEYKDAILVHFLAGTGPDVIAVSTLWFEELQAQGVFLDLTDYLAASGYSTGDIFPTSLQAWQDRSGRQFALPFDNDIAVLLYNNELFARYGVTPPNDGWTWDDWYLAGLRLTMDTDGDELNDVFGMMTNWWTSWYSLIWANGGTIFTPDRRPNVRAQEVIEALEWYAQWFPAGRNLQVNAGSQVQHLGVSSPHLAFANGHIAMMPAGVWAIDYTARGPEGWRFEFGAAPLPMSPAGGRATAIEGQGQAVSVHGRNKDAAYRFVELMATEGQAILARRGQFPVTRSDALSDAFLGDWDPKYKAVAIEATSYARPLPQGVMWPVTKSHFEGVFAYFNGTQPLAQVLEDIERQMLATLTELGILP